MNGLQVAVAKTYLEAYAALPKAQQKKAREFTEKFRHDPTAPGINFERVDGAADENVRSVRIDQAYRAIVVHPAKGNVYLLVWVDHHDNAYDWVRNRRFEVNPSSGSLQIYEVIEDQMPAAKAAVAPRLFDGFDDEDLILAGVPSPLLAAVRALKTDDDLDRLGPHLPEEAAEVLYLLAAGYDLLEAIEGTEGSSSPQEVDPGDFVAALERPGSQRVFTVVENEHELERMLDAPLEQWRVFLHPTQRKLIQMNAKGPVRVLGGAGTGKTVALMHRAKHLVNEVFTSESDRVLVTTYTRNLALDLAMNLKNLCGDKFTRLEVVNLHSWAVRFMLQQGIRFAIATDEETSQFMESAVIDAGGDRPVAFYRDEWKHVVQAQDVATQDDYLTARRVGRGTRLARRDRAEVWKVLSRYRELLDEVHKVEWDDIVRETRLYMQSKGIASPYCSVVADEAQDFTPNDLRLIRLLAPEAPNTLFLAGDAHQRIYGVPIRLSTYGIDVRGRSRRLKLNYRTTSEIRRRAVSILEGCDVDDLDGALDTMKGYHSLRHGPAPSIHLFANEGEEAEFCVEKIREWLEHVPPESICVSARRRSQVTGRYRSLLENAGIKTLIVETDPESEARKPGVRLATMHRMKGLEFPRVLLVGVHAGSVPLENAIEEAADVAGRQDAELRERCLLHVAATRARDELAIAGYGKACRFL